MKDALTVPNQALRFTPPAQNQEAASRGSGLLGLLIPRRPSNGSSGRAGGNGGHTVYVLRDNQPVAVPVETGSTDGSRTVIAKGELKAGDQVIVASRTAT